jgi:hypothetical protein
MRVTFDISFSIGASQVSIRTPWRWQPRARVIYVGEGWTHSCHPVTPLFGRTIERSFGWLKTSKDVMTEEGEAAARELDERIEELHGV